MQAFFFHDLRSHFLLLQGQTGLSAVFLQGGRNDIVGPEDPVARDQLRADFATFARRAMAALGFKFSDPARAVNYWLELLRQESPHFKESRIANLCLASADFCNELETRALEAIVETESTEHTKIAGDLEGKKKAVDSRSNDRLLSWKDITISFLDSENVEVRTSDRVQRLHYSEMGFADRRGRAVGSGRATGSWRWLMYLAEHRGVIEMPHRREPRMRKGPVDAEQPASELQALSRERGSTVNARTELQGMVKTLRKQLRLHFPNIPGEPILFEHTRYRALFQIGKSEYFHA